MAKCVPTPSPEEIELRAREIRVKWSDREAEKRRVYKTKIVYIPVSETYFTEPAVPRANFNLKRRLLQLD